MSWIQKLYETYEQCQGRVLSDIGTLVPVGHSIQQAHVEITLDAEGNFKSARAIGKVETVIPATEQSAGRSGRAPSSHPLCDKIQFCAGDYKAMGGCKPSFFNDFTNKKNKVVKGYKTLLTAWCGSSFSHPKVRAILSYVSKEKLASDLIAEKILHVDADGKLLTNWHGDTPTPEVFKVLTPDPKTKLRDQGNLFIRWHVWEIGNPCTAVWEDATLQESWAKFDASTKNVVGVCMVTGEERMSLALNHPRRIRHSGDNAKLISANDSSGYTFRGRFTDETGLQACGVGYEVTQKAHNALRWLIQRQAYRNEDQVIVTWSVAGKPVPDPFKDSRSLFLDSEEVTETPLGEQVLGVGDAGQAFALRLKKVIAGYGAKFGPTDDIVVLGLDSATPGRMAIAFYRELKGSEFLDRLQSWHQKSAWLQNFGKDSRFVGAPAPRDIAEAAFGRRLDYKLRRATIERLLPCIVDGQRLPRDLVDSVVRRTCNRVGMDHWEWEKNLGIACAVFRAYFYERNYQMTLEADRTSRDYLYGRLLAVAEHIESRALFVGKETRDTTAAKLMQRFADRPASTWRTIELALAPSKSRLRAKRPPFLYEMEKLHDSIVCSFVGNDFLDDKKLSGEFLLGYHCQRRDLNPPKVDPIDSTEESLTT